MPTSLSNITVKDSSHTLIVKSNDITIDGTSIQTQINNKANDADVVHKANSETITGQKTFSNGILRSSNIDQSSTSGEVEVGSISIADKNGFGVGLYNTTRSNTTNTNRQRVCNRNVSDTGYWYDLRVQLNDAGQGFVVTAKGSNVTDGSTTSATSSIGSTAIPTMGWVNNPATSTNVVHRSGDETIAGNKTYSSAIIVKSGYDSTVAPSSYSETKIIQANDTNNILNTSLRAARLINGSIEARLYAGNNGTNKSILVGVTSNGSGYTSAPIPSEDTTSSTQIDTVGARNTKLANYVPTTRTVNGKALSSNITLAKGDIGLGNIDNTADTNKSVASAAKLTTKRTIDGVEFDGSANITHYGTCSTAAATQEKVVACTGFKLETGAVIFVKFTAEANGADNPTLNVNSTGAKAIQYRGSAISKGYLRINRTYVFVYDGTYYQLIGDLDSNTTDRLQIANNIKAATAITAGRAIVGTSAGYKNIGSGITFDISYPILIAGSAISASNTGTNNFRAISGRSVRDITGNSSWTGTQYATVYLVLSALNGVTATIDSTLMTTTVPTSADNKFYIPIGYMYSTYQCYFCPQDKIYAYVNGKFQEYGSAGGDTSDCVKLTGNQTIAGIKIFMSPMYVSGNNTTIYVRNAEMKQGVNPSQALNCYPFYVIDKNSKLLCYANLTQSPSGDISTSLNVRDQYGDNTGSLKIGYNSSGNLYTSAPTPATSDNSTQIATTAYVNNKLQVVSALPASPDSNIFYFIPA